MVDDMQFIGLLTDQQKRAGYFTTQSQDFVWLWHRRDGNPDIIAVWLYDGCQIKQVREAADDDMEIERKLKLSKEVKDGDNSNRSKS